MTRYRVAIELQREEIYAPQNAQGAEDIQRVVLDEPVVDQLMPVRRATLFRCSLYRPVVPVLVGIRSVGHVAPQVSLDTWANVRP